MKRDKDMGVKLISVQKLLLCAVVAGTAQYAYFAIKNRPEDLSASITSGAMLGEIAPSAGRVVKEDEWVSQEIAHCMASRTKAIKDDNFIPNSPMTQDECTEIAHHSRDKARVNRAFSE